MLKKLLLVTSLVGLVGLALPAAAQPPARTEGSVSLMGPHFLSGFCGMEILHTGTLHAATTTFSDGRSITQIRVDATLTANGKEAYENANFTVTIDPAAGTVTLTGAAVNIHAPGEGNLVHDVGRVVRQLPTGDIVSVAGRWMVLEGQTEKICAYFADM